MATDRICSHGEAQLAIYGRDIYFYFDRKKKTAVLNDINISVTRGIIYSLLGPSGCGKTTLLKCIIGQHKLQVGSLRIYGKVPGSKGFFIPGRGVGYMPQEMALYSEMSAQETLIYFGSLYHMSPQKIKERISFLIDLLALPDKKKLIKHLSGGQQRRVSLAAALIHTPPLLILDEPTVGVDPLLRQDIWDHLAKLSKDERLTIMITTHYIEEARQADVVGLMRNGHLLAERNPEVLIKQYQVATLENVFLKLCQRNRSESMDYKTASSVPSVEIVPNKHSTVQVSKEESESYSDKELLGKSEQVFILSPVKKSRPCEASKCLNNGTCNDRNETQDTENSLLSHNFHEDLDCVTSSHTFRESLRRTTCLTKNNFLRFKRNHFLLVVQVLLPCVEIAIFCLCVGTNPFGLQLAVTNLEENPGGLGKELLLSIDNTTMRQKEYSNFSEALESVRKGESWAAMYIGPEFTNCIFERYILFMEPDNDTVDCSEIKLHLDMSNQIIAYTIYRSLMTTFQTFAADMLSKYDKNPALSNLPIMLKEPIYGSLETTVNEFLIPAVVICVTYLVSVGMTALSIILEKKQGLLDRTFVAGATPAEVLTSLFIVMLLTLSVQITLVLACTAFLFDIPCYGPFVWVVVAVFLAGVNGMAYGMCLSSVCDDENTAIFFAVASIFGNIFLSGIIWPIEGMPFCLRYLSYCLPLTLISQSVRSIISRGWNVTDYYTWDGYLVSIGWIVLLIGLSLLFFKIKK